MVSEYIFPGVIGDELDWLDGLYGFGRGSFTSMPCVDQKLPVIVEHADRADADVVRDFDRIAPTSRV